MKTILKLSLLLYSLHVFGQPPIQDADTINISSPHLHRPIIDILIKRWKQSKIYTLKVLEVMPEDQIEYRPSDAQMSFAQHFIHIGFINNSFIGILMDTKTYPSFEAHKDAPFFIKRPDPIHLFLPDHLQKRNPKTNKKLVYQYVSDTFDYVISSLEKLNDEALTKGANKEKPQYLKGHTNLDLILRGENHTAHHRGQAILYLRMNGVIPPDYSEYNTL